MEEPAANHDIPPLDANTELQARVDMQMPDVLALIAQIEEWNLERIMLITRLAFLRGEAIGAAEVVNVVDSIKQALNRVSDETTSAPQKAEDI